MRKEVLAEEFVANSLLEIEKVETLILSDTSCLKEASAIAIELSGDISMINIKNQMGEKNLSNLMVCRCSDIIHSEFVRIVYYLMNKKPFFNWNCVIIFHAVAFRNKTD